MGQLSKKVELDDLLAAPSSPIKPNQDDSIENRRENKSNDVASPSIGSDPLGVSGNHLKKESEPIISRDEPLKVKTGNAFLDEAMAKRAKEKEEKRLSSNSDKQEVQKSEAEEPTTTKPKASLKSYQNKTEKSLNETVDFKIVFATLKAYTPLISAATYAPGADGNGSDMAQAVTHMINKTAELTQMLCDITGVDSMDVDSQWKVSRLRELASEQIALQWKDGVSEGKKEFNLVGAAYAYKATGDAAKSTTDDAKFPKISETLRLQMSAMKSMMPVIKEFHRMENYMSTMFNGFKFKQSVFEDISNEIFEESMAFVNKINKTPGDEDGRLIMLQSTLNNAGTMYAHAVASFSNKLISKASLMPIADRQKFLYETAKNTSSLIDLNAVNVEFKRDFAYLTQIAENAPMKYAVSASYSFKNQ